MTFLELVNKVLKGLREDPVGTLSGDYADLIAQFVNDAKEDIEDSGPWYSLRTVINKTLTASTSTLDLTAETNERSYLMYVKNQPMAFVVTDNEERRLQVVEHGEILAIQALSPDAQSDVPCAVAFTHAAGGLTATFFPTPDAAYNVRFQMVVPQAELEDIDDVLTIPSRPVWQAALVMAMDERGEEFAGPLARTEKKAAKSLLDAMSNDFLKDDLTFEAL